MNRTKNVDFFGLGGYVKRIYADKRLRKLMMYRSRNDKNKHVTDEIRGSSEYRFVDYFDGTAYQKLALENHILPHDLVIGMYTYLTFVYIFYLYNCI